ncbi:MAG TPA: cellulose binding domain-containing protein, partial [Bacillota bacterium]|nr:cellulose binding domain-containing protein [Bacillota bacterium]
MFNKTRPLPYVVVALGLLLTVAMVFAADPTVPETGENPGIAIKMVYADTNETTKQITPRFTLTNNGSSAVNLSQLKLRYYYTIDGERPQSFWCDYATFGKENVIGSFVKLDVPVVGADYYLEVGFNEAAGVLNPGVSTEVQVRFAKADWAFFDQSNDYSFSRGTGENVRIAVFSGENPIWGAEVPYVPVPVIKNKITVHMYNGNVAPSNNSILPRFKLFNQGDTTIKLSDIKLRYYYTADGGQNQQFWCDWSSVKADNVTGEFVKLNTKVPHAYYLEVGFKDTAGELLPRSTVEVHTRIAKNDRSNYNQQDDYSFNSSASNYIGWDKVSGLVNGVFKWGNVATDFDGLTGLISLYEQGTGGTIYLMASKMTCNGQLKLRKENANIRIEACPGFTPVLDFSPIRSKSGDSYVGVRIQGSWYYLKGLIIEKAGDNGVQIKPTSGSTASYNTLENCVVRYNGDAGVQISGSSSVPDILPSYNTLINVDVYRNFDVDTNGGNADGFACKLLPGPGNKFMGCRAWENSDDGWDLYATYYDVTMENCVVWHNGDTRVFTGEYDFITGQPLDENLYLVELFKKDPTFCANLASGNFVLPVDLLVPKGNQTVAAIFAKWGGNGNGFKLGSGASKYGPQTTGTRTLT